MSKSDQDNRSNQLNPNNDAYWSSRGLDRPSGSDDDDFGRSVSPAEFCRLLGSHLTTMQVATGAVVPVYLDFILQSGRLVHLTFNVSFSGYAVSGRNGSEALDVVEMLYEYIAACTAAHFGEAVAWGEVHDHKARPVSWLSYHGSRGEFAWPSHEAYAQREQIKLQWCAREAEAVARLHRALEVGPATIGRITIGQAKHSAIRSRRDRVPLRFDGVENQE